MATAIYRSQEAGVPGQWDETLTGNYQHLVTGSEPAVMTMDLPVAASQTLAPLTVVGLNASGALVPAVAGTTEAIGILVVGVTTTASTTLTGAPVYRAGCFNPDLLVWDTSYADDGDKFNAFEGAPTPTNIIIRRPKTATVS